MQLGWYLVPKKIAPYIRSCCALLPRGRHRDLFTLHLLARAAALLLVPVQLLLPCSSLFGCLFRLFRKGSPRRAKTNNGLLPI